MIKEKDGYLAETPCGKIFGSCEEDGTAIFRGIRYATAGRWEYPKQVTQWEGIYRALEFGNCSWQPRSFCLEEEMPEKTFYYNEFRRGDTFSYGDDCLFLNIWTPEKAENVPVLFYIHGGGFKGGCGHEKHFDGKGYCRKDIIVVTINYRLGPMGFLCHPQLQKEAGHTGNYGLFDQMAALRWIYDNIASFGGDNSKITIMGQSAGAMSVQLHCVSPLTDGLFAGAIMMSGGGVSNKFGKVEDVEQAFAFGEDICRQLHVETIEELRNTAAEDLFLACQQLSRGEKGLKMVFGPVNDHMFLESSAAEIAKQGKQKGIPYLMGSTSEDIAPPILYKMAKSWARLQSDQNKKPSYVYFFDRQLPGDGCGAWHSSDLWYAFGALRRCWRPFTDWDFSLSESMMEYFAAFIHKGNPNKEGLPVWLPISKGQNKVLRFGDREICMGGVSVVKLVNTMLTHPSVGE